MRLIIISLSALFLSLALVIGGNAYLLTYLGVRLGAEGIPPTQVGFVMVCYSIGFAIGSHYATHLVAKVGHIRTFAAMAALTAMASISYPLLDSVYFWALLRFVGGITAAALYVIIESWFSAVASNNNRGTLFALYQVAAYGSSTLAQLTVGYSEPLSPVPFTGAALLLLAAIIPLSLSRMQSPRIEPGPKMSLIKLYREAPLGLTCAFTGGILLGAYYSLVPLFGSLTGMSIREVSQLMTASVLLALVLAWPVGWICDRVQRSKVMLVITLTATFLSLAVALTVDLPFLARIVPAAVLLGMLTLVNSVAVALTHDRIDASARVAASSALMLCYGVGSIIGPVAGSMLMEAFAPEAMFIGFASLAVLLASYVRYRQKRMPPLPITAQEHYVATMPETQLSTEFDPRYETEEENETSVEDIFPDEWVEAWGDDASEEKASEPEPSATSEEIEVGGEMIGMEEHDAEYWEEKRKAGESVTEAADAQDETAPAADKTEASPAQSEPAPDEKHDSEESKGRKPD
ncbi:MFS transporter [Marinobacterium lutimaris]|uniref:Predicted arabinose efflux permease, MFS family n=1 Tax=Marinobacterium lutimaris TaxID=568106 RepID=A0A1H6CRW7_9GAMM|nr:MFS transporter [Marinobacterium lutimaris]SEG75779.1 Predicted arabinose efflux permease, MFS family [Marinobacterium lutimaris]